jgi:hypothetical protein
LINSAAVRHHGLGYSSWPWLAASLERVLTEAGLGGIVAAVREGRVTVKSRGTISLHGIEWK